MCVALFAELNTADRIRWELEMPYIAAKIWLGILQEIFLGNTI